MKDSYFTSLTNAELSSQYMTEWVHPRIANFD